MALISALTELVSWVLFVTGVRGGFVLYFGSVCGREFLATVSSFVKVCVFMIKGAKRAKSKTMNTSSVAGKRYGTISRKRNTMDR